MGAKKAIGNAKKINLKDIPEVALNQALIYGKKGINIFEEKAIPEIQTYIMEYRPLEYYLLVKYIDFMCKLGLKLNKWGPKLDALEADLLDGIPFRKNPEEDILGRRSYMVFLEAGRIYESENNNIGGNSSGQTISTQNKNKDSYERGL
jgi:hypothetical protein